MDKYKNAKVSNTGKSAERIHPAKMGPPGNCQFRTPSPPNLGVVTEESSGLTRSQKVPGRQKCHVAPKRNTTAKEGNKSKQAAIKSRIRFGTPMEGDILHYISS